MAQLTLREPGKAMRLHLKGFENNNSDAIIVIECQCGTKRVLDEAGEFQSKEVFVYRHGVPVKDLRCATAGTETLERLAEGKPPCRERYRVTVHGDDDPPRIEVAHLSPRPQDQVLETETIKFPPKRVGPTRPINPPPSTPYVNRPYDTEQEPE